MISLQIKEKAILWNDEEMLSMRSVICEDSKLAIMKSDNYENCVSSWSDNTEMTHTKLNKQLKNNEVIADFELLGQTSHSTVFQSQGIVAESESSSAVCSTSNWFGKGLQKRRKK